MLTTVLAVAAPGAAAATVQIGMSGGTLVVAESPGGAVVVTIASQPPMAPPVVPGVIVIGTPALYSIAVDQPATVAPPCLSSPSGGGTVANCPSAGVSAISVDVGDGNDTLATTSIPGAPPFAPVTARLGDGSDTAFGDGGALTVDAGAGDDKVTVTAGSATIDGGDGADSITTTIPAPGFATVRGGAGRDVVFATGTTDRLDGGPDDDRLTVGGSAAGDGFRDTVSCGAGIDAVKGVKVGEDVVSDDCPPPDALQFAPRGRIVFAGGTATATVTARARVPLRLAQVRLFVQGGRPLTLGILRSVRVAGTTPLRFRLGARARARVRNRSSLGVLLSVPTRGARRADGGGDAFTPSIARPRLAITR